ncbi:tyrosine-type recombinase/integrase [Jeotgalibaca porci]|uniref:tyrosine-type recombinase/integrase n=1 Tax=Jeotgalibaca porci TaxID=1868793 RepID=UPI0035A1AF47
MWIEELPNGKYKYFERYKDPYTDKWRKKSVTLSSASRQAQKQAKNELDEKIRIELKTKTVANHTFHFVFEEWYQSHIKTLRNSSKVVYKSIYNIVKKDIPSDILINNIDTRYMQKFMDSLDYSIDYIYTFKSVFNLIFRYAWKMNFIDHNPMERVELNFRPKRLEEAQNIKEKYLEREEAEALIKELYRRPSTYRLGRLAEFMYLTGVRVGEAIILRPSDFDFEESILKITGTLDVTKGYRNATKGPTKTINSTRDVAITKRTIHLVNKTIAENKLQADSVSNYLPGEYLFATKSGTPIQINSFNLALKGAGARVDLSNKQLSSHIFRHTHVSILAELGLPEKTIMDRVGHEDSDITKRIYMHVTEGMKKQAIDKLELDGL